jgi:hypothetical protein
VRARTVASPLAAAAIAALIAGCGGSSGQVSRDALKSPGMPSAHPASAKEKAAAVTPTPVATTGRACSAGDLSAVYLQQDDSKGRTVLSLVLSNRGHAICHTYGWPMVRLLALDGRALRARARLVTADALGKTPASVVALAPGRRASFRVIASERKPHGGHVGCATVHALRIRPPDGRAAIDVSIPGGARECANVTVSPLQPGNAAASFVSLRRRRSG